LEAFALKRRHAPHAATVRKEAVLKPHNFMMSYELAKQLKETGFPHDWTHFDDHDPELLKINWSMYGEGYTPTLEELVEAFGKHFYGLEQEELHDWVAFAKPSGKAIGATPTEAVARLWLSLPRTPITHP
jgi:hypothetical protein